MDTKFVAESLVAIAS